MNTKLLGIFAVLVAGLIAMTGLVFAETAESSGNIENPDLNVSLVSMKFNGHQWDELDTAKYTFNVERGQKVNFELLLGANEYAKNVQVRAEIAGYTYKDSDQLTWISPTFTMNPNSSKTLSGYLTMSVRMENGPSSFRVHIYDGKNQIQEYLFPIYVDGMSESKALVIREVFVTPQTIKAGRTLIAKVNMKNYGNKLKDVVVRASIPSLGVSDTDIIDTISTDAAKTSEELMLQIPACTPAGTYKVVTTVTWEDGDYSTTSESEIEIVESETCRAVSEKGFETETVLSIGAVSTEAQKGKAIAYPVSITNTGAKSRTYTLSIEGTNGWATVNVNPTNTFVVQAGETKSMFIELMPNADAAEGQRMFTATLSSGAESLAPVALTANVAAGKTATTSMGDALKIGLVVLVVILVILALVVGFNKLKGSDDEDSDESGQTYY